MPTKDEWLDRWLRDAHAMEQQAEQVLQAQIQRLENYPQFRRRVEEHLTETERQRTLVEGCLSRRGTSPSSLKDAAGKLTAMVQGFTGVVAGDEVVKAALVSYAFEQFEAISYRILASAAEAAGDMETARICAEICREEEAMAAWLANHAPEVTHTFLERDMADREEAKR